MMSPERRIAQARLFLGGARWSVHWETVDYKTQALLAIYFLKLAILESMAA